MSGAVHADIGLFDGGPPLKLQTRLGLVKPGEPRVIRRALFVVIGVPVLLRLEVDLVDDRAGKPVGIHQVIGRRPIAAFGNSDGEFEMLEWTTSGSGSRFGLIVHHTDAEREWAYDRKSHIGQLVRGLDEASKRGWIVVDMKQDWKVIYPFQK